MIKGKQTKVIISIVLAALFSITIKEENKKLKKKSKAFKLNKNSIKKFILF